VTNPANITLDAEKLTTLADTLRGMVTGDVAVGEAMDTVRTVGEEVFAPHRDAIAAGTARIPGFCLFDETGYDLELALRSVGSGWGQIIRHIYAVMPANVRVEQVKEKYGGLRLYYSWIVTPRNGDTRMARALGWLRHLWWRALIGHWRIQQFTRWLRALWLRVTGLYSASEAWERVVSLAEDLSYKTCESCGAPGVTRPHGWVVTLCDMCDIEMHTERSWIGGGSGGSECCYKKEA
jgi:hypothetical protein